MRREMLMKLRVLLLPVLFGFGPVHNTFGDDGVAVTYAQDAVDVMTANLERLQELQRSRAVPASQVDKRESELRDAKITLLRLQGDREGLERLMRTTVEREEDRLNRLKRIAKRGYAGPDHLRVGELRLLIAKLNLARQIADERTVTQIINRAVTLEEARLQSISDQVSRGFTPASAIAVQKLRIAELILTQQIRLPTADEAGSR